MRLSPHSYEDEAILVLVNLVWEYEETVCESSTSEVTLLLILQWYG